MIIGLDNITQSNRCGIPTHHFHAILKATATSTRQVIGFRPVSPFAKTPLLEGCPTKPFTIKTKSVKIGPLAGFLSVDPQYTSLEKPNEKNKYSKQIETILAENENVVPTSLVISQNRINEIQELSQNAVQVSMNKDKQSYKFTWKKNNDTVELFAKQIDDGKYLIVDKEQDGEPVQVLGKVCQNHQGKSKVHPITSDYDLLVICPEYSDLDMQFEDKTIFKVQGSQRKNIEDIDGKRFPDLNEDPQKGNISKRTERIIHGLNQFIGELDAHRNSSDYFTVHHNQEMHNPYSQKIEDDLPALFFLPKNVQGFMMCNNIKINLSQEENRILLIETIEEMKLLRDIVTDEVNGFYWPTHPKYAAVIHPFRRNSMESFKSLLNAKGYSPRFHHHQGAINTDTENKKEGVEIQAENDFRSKNTCN